MALSVFVPLVKIDEEKRLVIGRAAIEEPDKSGEIMDYARSKPNFEAWSRQIEEASGGLSKGNLRAMHTRHVAGKIVDLAFNDQDKAIDIVAKVVDPTDWSKVLEGAYTGFSVGGGYGDRWPDGSLKRYEAKPSEISLVDNPCMPSARFAELVKADGLVEQIALRGVVRGFADLWQARPRGFAEQWSARPQGFAELWAARQAGRTA